METKCFVLLFTLLWSLGLETKIISTSELTGNRQSTELEEQSVVDRKLRLVRSDSPYQIKHDLLIDKNGELEIEPGVELHFAPMVGLTVRGLLLAKGEPNSKIIFRGLGEPDSKILPEIRLVDGPSILEGRLQLFFNDRWRSVCSNSRNWTRSDLETACRQMGFQGGSWLNWLDREAGARPRLCLEEPSCRGTETQLSQCRQWNTRQMGAGVCDYHPDLAIRCDPVHATSPALNVHWRGIRFEDARHERQLRQENTLFVEMGLSELQHVEIRHAGSGRDYNTSSAIEVVGVPPQISHITIAHSLYNAINITNPGAPFTIYNSSIYGNRGHGIFVNSTFGLGHIIGCTITDNNGDGIRYIMHWPQSQKGMQLLNINPFCGFATTPSMIYPVHLTIHQTKESITDLNCIKVFQTKPGQVLTIHLPWMETSLPQATANVRIYDGAKLSDRLLAEIPLLNNTRSQSVTSTSYIIMVHYQAKAGNYVLGYLTLTSGKGRSYDLNVTQTTLASNLGRGIAIDNLRSLLHVHASSISDNNHVAGVHVTSGVGHINITESRIAFNHGDGINITVTGGARNITNCSLSSNRGYGIAIWLNETKRTEYNFIEQNSVIAYSDIFLNEDGGFFHGNFCLSSNVNITGNNFTDSPRSSIEVLSCWRPHSEAINLQIGHNLFQNMKKLAIRLKPALNMNARIEYNYFTGGYYGALLINNPFLEEFDILPTHILVSNNHFENNQGIFVASLSLSIYSEVQHLNFTRNFIRDNRIKEPYDPALVPRGRVAAPLVVGSNNVNVFRNILQNPESQYEIGSQLEDQSIDINCTYNYLGSKSEEIIFSRLFDRKDRYNLARILYIPYLLHDSNPSSTYFINHATFVPFFKKAGSNQIGGEIDGLEKLKVGTYEVVRDISVRPQGTLQIQSGVTLRFSPGVGMIVAGRLEARGRFANDILFDLKEDISENNTLNGYGSGAGSGFDSEVETVFITESPENSPSIRLLGGKNSHEGRLQVRDTRGYWGTVCDYGWTLKSAAIACHELGLIANPHDWRINRADIPEAGISEPILWSNVRCRDEDLTLTQCLKELSSEFENSCTHSQDVGLRCYPNAWAGVRVGPLAPGFVLQHVTIKRAGLLDYALNTLTPGVQLDFSAYTLEGLHVIDSLADGLAVIYANIYAPGDGSILRNAILKGNRGSGIRLAQAGLRVEHSIIEENEEAGIRHDPAVPSHRQRELAGWFTAQTPTSTLFAQEAAPYRTLLIPSTYTDINIEQNEFKVLITQRVGPDPVKRIFHIRCPISYVLGIQLLNPIANRSTEKLFFWDGLREGEGRMWDIGRDSHVFPMLSQSYGIVLDYSNGKNALGNAVLVLTAIPARPAYPPQYPTLKVTHSKIRKNRYGLLTEFHNRHLSELGEHYLRKANMSIELINCALTQNKREAILVYTAYAAMTPANLSEIHITINNSLITDNQRGIRQFSRDLRNSNNLFHWMIHDTSVERNAGGGFDVLLPYVRQFNENYTHTIYLGNVTWRNNKRFSAIIDGHYANVNITRNVFDNNNCRTGLLSIRGMEKKLLITHNRITSNRGSYIVEFRIDSQSEVHGFVDARMTENELKDNSEQLSAHRTFYSHRLSYRPPSTVIGFDGIQKVFVAKNLFGNNSLDYEVIAGVRTHVLDNVLELPYNWWGTANESQIASRIFDFDDWNDHAIVNFWPYLLEDSLDASLSVNLPSPPALDLNKLGGRLRDSVTLYAQTDPYLVLHDLTVMPEATLTIDPGVVLEFAPGIGILVLGTLRAIGHPTSPIEMRPLSSSSSSYRNNEKRHRRQTEFDSYFNEKIEDHSQNSLRLCTSLNCTISEESAGPPREGFLEIFNMTTLQWVPICEDAFSEDNARVVCRQLGFDPLDPFLARGRRYEYHPNSLTRIWSFAESVQCSGDEDRLEDCEPRLNGQIYDQRRRCQWNSEFVFIHCGKRNLHLLDYWGGIRFANGQLEKEAHEKRLHDPVTHGWTRRPESIFEWVKIVGAGLLHGKRSPTILSISRAPRISYINISQSAGDGIVLLSPPEPTRLLFNRVEDTLGVGVSLFSLTGEARDDDESSFTPLRLAPLPHGLFGALDICDPAKVITLEERILVYFIYASRPISCVKIFASPILVKPFGFRLLQLNLFNSSGLGDEPDMISLYDGDIFNVTTRLIGKITYDSNNEKKLFRTNGGSLSIQITSRAASRIHGFVAEVVTLPISAIGFNRDVQHNISYSILARNRLGALQYGTAGEVNPAVTMEWNQIDENCAHLFGNFTTCLSAVYMDIQNTLHIHFRNNLVRRNQGGVVVKADSRSSATALKGWFINNLFAENENRPVLFVEGRQSSPYQEVTIYRNIFANNHIPYDDVIVLRQVVSNFTYNFVQNNIGQHILEVSGFQRVRLPIYQSTSHNTLYLNYALDRNNRGTILAGTAGQQYVDNIFLNPDNDYELITVNETLYNVHGRFYHIWPNPVDAKHNWWGYNTSLAVGGRVKERGDQNDLLRVEYEPFHYNNRSLLDVKCPPAWNLVGDTCYIYIGAPMNFFQAREFCTSVNASMPYVMGNYLSLFKLLARQQHNYQYFDHVWVQNYDLINRCTAFAYQSVEIDDCNRLNPFICETDPKVRIDPLSWREDVVTVAVIGAVGAALLLVAFAAGCWLTKSKHRHVERLERRNSIRQSLHSVRSIGLASTNGPFSEINYKRRPNIYSGKSSPSLSAQVDYKKMMDGSIDSMEKSQFNSSVEDDRSYDIYEAHNDPSNCAFNLPEDYSQNPRGAAVAINPGFDLSYRNHGYRDNSTFASGDNWQSDYGDSSTDYAHNASTLPLDASLALTDSILDMKRSIAQENGEKPSRALAEPQSLPQTMGSANTRQGTSQLLLETDLDAEENNSPSRSKSEAILDKDLSSAPRAFHRSKSQPLETAM